MASIEPGRKQKKKKDCRRQSSWGLDNMFIFVANAKIFLSANIVIEVLFEMRL